MKNIKRLAALAISAVLVLGMSLTVSASSLDYSWDETYNGSKIADTYDTSAASSAFANVQPGDSFTLKASLHNTSGSDSDWYLQNSVLQTLQDASNSGSAGYTYILSYNGTPIYDSSNVGAGSASGLKDATADINGSVMYLDTIKDGGTGELTLTVKFDGSSIDNEYMSSAAKLSLAFSAEKSTGEPTVLNVGDIVEEKEVITQGAAKSSTTSVKTGDSSRILIFSIIGLVAGFALLAMFVVSIRRNKKGEA